LAAGAIGIFAGLVLHYTGICPVVKRIWTPAWTLFSGGLCFLYLSAFCSLTEVRVYRRWAFPLVVIGMNSIAAYLISETLRGYVESSLRIHLGPHFFAFLGGPGAAGARRGGAFAVGWRCPGCTGARSFSRSEFRAYLATKTR
jgi:hypothetical protein